MNPKFNQKAVSASGSTSCSPSLIIPIKLWAEIDGERFEKSFDLKIPIREGECPELAKSIMLKPSAEIVAHQMIKTGYSLQNAK